MENFHEFSYKVQLHFAYCYHEEIWENFKHVFAIFIFLKFPFENFCFVLFFFYYCVRCYWYVSFLCVFKLFLQIFQLFFYNFSTFCFLFFVSSIFFLYCFIHSHNFFSHSLSFLLLLPFRGDVCNIFCTLIILCLC